MTDIFIKDKRVSVDGMTWGSYLTEGIFYAPEGEGWNVEVFTKQPYAVYMETQNSGNILGYFADKPMQDDVLKKSHLEVFLDTIETLKLTSVVVSEDFTPLIGKTGVGEKWKVLDNDLLRPLFIDMVRPLINSISTSKNLLVFNKKPRVMTAYNKDCTAFLCLPLFLDCYFKRGNTIPNIVGLYYCLLHFSKLLDVNPLPYGNFPSAYTNHINLFPAYVVDDTRPIEGLDISALEKILNSKGEKESEDEINSKNIKVPAALNGIIGEMLKRQVPLSSFYDQVEDFYTLPPFEFVLDEDVEDFDRAKNKTITVLKKEQVLFMGVHKSTLYVILDSKSLPKNFDKGKLQNDLGAAFWGYYSPIVYVMEA